MRTCPATSGCAYTWSSTGTENTAPNCWTLTLAVVSAASLSFRPERVLSLCCVSTETDCAGGGGGGFVPSLGAWLSLQLASNRKPSDASFDSRSKIFLGTGELM